MAKTPESRLKKEITTWLTGIGAWWDMPVRAGYGRRGIPDILCCVNGKFIAIEVKVGGKVPTAWQLREIAAIKAAGGKAAVVWSLSEAQRLVFDQDME